MLKKAYKFFLIVGFFELFVVYTIFLIIGVISQFPYNVLFVVTAIAGFFGLVSFFAGGENLQQRRKTIFLLILYVFAFLSFIVLSFTVPLSWVLPLGPPVAHSNFCFIICMPTHSLAEAIEYLVFFILFAFAPCLLFFDACKQLKQALYFSRKKNISEESI